MRFSITSISLLITILVAGSSHGAESPENFLRRLYKMHFAQINDSSYWLNDKKKISEYFDDEMTALFLKDIECRERNQEICNLDFDPIIDAQDNDEKNLKLVNVQKSLHKTKNRYKVTFVNFQTTTISYDLKETSKGWRISDIIYAEGWPLKKILSTE